jgi:hypothetical protein
MKGDNLPPDHHVVRLVTYSRLRKDENNTPIGVNFDAFLRRENEDGLSVTWLEYLPGATKAERTVAAVQAIRASAMTVSAKSGFAIGNVGAISATCAERQHKIRVIHWPEDDNKAHAEIRQLPRDDLVLLERLASSTWSELVLNAGIKPTDAAKAAPDEPATN